MRRPTTAIIDGDIIVYRAGFATQHTRYHWGKHTSAPGETKKGFIERLSIKTITNITTSLDVEDISHACHTTKRIIQQILEKTDAEEYIIYLTSLDHSNYRYKIAKTKPYHGNRKAPRPKHFDAIREYLIKYWDAQVVYGIEADDAMAIHQCSVLDYGVICTIDKDLDMIPGWHYNFVKDDMYYATRLGELTLKKLDSGRVVLKGTGLKWFWAQVLLGDNADNIPGIDGYGPVKVHKLLGNLKTEKDLQSTVTKVYMDTFGFEVGDARLCEVCQLLWIQQTEDDIYSPF